MAQDTRAVELFAPLQCALPGGREGAARAGRTRQGESGELGEKLSRAGKFGFATTLNQRITGRWASAPRTDRNSFMELTMATRDDLVNWVYEAINEHGGEASVLQVAKHIWKNRESELKQSGDLFFTWQYDMRWAALKLRKAGTLLPAGSTRKGLWNLAR